MCELLGDRFRLVVPDLPGAGRSAIPAADRPLSGAALGTFIGELQEALGIGGCPTVGNSLGGYLCLRAALQDPGRFARLAVVHPPMFEPRLVALHAALAVPGVAAVLARVARHDPLRWAHSQVHYYDETLKSLEEAHEYGDPLASAAGRRLHALLPDSEFHWMGETSHFPQVDRPARLAELLVDFLERP